MARPSLPGWTATSDVQMVTIRQNLDTSEQQRHGMELQWSPFSMENTFQDSQQSHPCYSQETQLLSFFPSMPEIYNLQPESHRPHALLWTTS